MTTVEDNVITRWGRISDALSAGEHPFTSDDALHLMEIAYGIRNTATDGSDVLALMELPRAGKTLTRHRNTLHRAYWVLLVRGYMDGGIDETDACTRVVEDYKDQLFDRLKVNAETLQKWCRDFRDVPT